jgi:hypothetical protein
MIAAATMGFTVTTATVALGMVIKFHCYKFCLEKRNGGGV